MRIQRTPRSVCSKTTCIYVCMSLHFAAIVRKQYKSTVSLRILSGEWPLANGCPGDGYWFPFGMRQIKEISDPLGGVSLRLTCVNTSVINPPSLSRTRLPILPTTIAQMFNAPRFVSSMPSRGSPLAHSAASSIDQQSCSRKLFEVVRLGEARSLTQGQQGEGADDSYLSRHVVDVVCAPQLAVQSERRSKDEQRIQKK